MSSFIVSEDQNVIADLFVRSSPNSTPSLFWVTQWMELLLQNVAIGGLGPTVTSRWLFIAGNMVYNSMQFLCGNMYVDQQYWTFNGRATYNYELQSFIERACQYGFPLLMRTYMGLNVDQASIDALVLAHKPLAPLPENKTNFELLLSYISQYLAARDGDGWKNTFTFNGTLPNGALSIDASNTVSQDLNILLPQPKAWTPLMINGVRKNYLTPEWGTANKGIIPDADWAVLLNNALALYPSDSAWATENQQVEELYKNLNTEEKMLAEFWAGGPNTVTPPGMWISFCTMVVRSNGLTVSDEIKLYTLIGTGLYQAGISAWYLKRQKMQGRPIQMIREAYYNQQIMSWNGSIQGQFWMPYQLSNFVTPPFPDFLSGHSTFSATSARLLMYFFGNDTIVMKKPVNSILIPYFSTIFNTNQAINFVLNDVFIYPGKSEIQPGTVPLSGISLSWNRWSDMAKSSGESRIYGGIHVESSNQAGLLLGNQLGDYLWNSIGKNL